MDLRNGIITVEDFDITANTKPEDMTRYFRVLEVRKFGSLTTIGFGNISLNLDGTNFYVRLRFDEDQLYEIRLWPKLEKRFPLGPSEEKQEELRRVSDVWLRREMGEPDLKNREETRYLIKGGVVRAQSSFGGRNPYELGYIVVKYDA